MTENSEPGNELSEPKGPIARFFALDDGSTLITYVVNEPEKGPHLNFLLDMGNGQTCELGTNIRHKDGAKTQIPDSVQVAALQSGIQELTQEKAQGMAQLLRETHRKRRQAIQEHLDNVQEADLAFMKNLLPGPMFAIQEPEIRARPPVAQFIDIDGERTLLLCHGEGENARQITIDGTPREIAFTDAKERDQQILADPTKAISASNPSRSMKNKAGPQKSFH